MNTAGSDVVIFITEMLKKFALPVLWHQQNGKKSRQ